MVVDIIVVCIVIFLVCAVIFFRFIFPKIMNRKIKNKGKECSSCVHCQHR